MISVLSLQAQKTEPPFIFLAPEIIILHPGGSDLEVDEEKNIILLDSENHKLHKIFAGFGYDSLLTIGGKGIEREAFNYPTKLVVQNRQNIYVLDYYNRRIVLLNVNLKVVREMNFLTINVNKLTGDPVELYPSMFTVGPSGELFLLNQDNNKVYKINTYGNPETVFGGTDYGDGRLITPDNIRIDHQNTIYITDTVEQEIKLYDLYGNFKRTLDAGSDFRWENVHLFENQVIFYNQEALLVFEPVTDKRVVVPLPAQEKTLLDLEVTKNYIYLLYPDQINVYRH